jgi:hypothetical protein
MSRQAGHEGQLMQESAALIESSMVQTLYDFVTKVVVQPEQSNGDVYSRFSTGLKAKRISQQTLENFKVNSQF